MTNILAHAKTVCITVLVCMVVGLVLYIRYEDGAKKGELDAKAEQVQQLQKQVETLSNLK